MKSTLLFLILCTYLIFCNAERWGNPIAAVPNNNFLNSGIESPSVDPHGNVYVGSNAGEYIAKVNVDNGHVTAFIPNPLGGSDDMDWRSDGILAYNDLLNFQTNVRKTNGDLIAVSHVPWPNGISFDNNGLLYMSTDPVGNGLWLLDPNGVNDPINVMNLSSPMNGFDFGADNLIYGPLNDEALLVRVDPVAKTQTTISSDWLDIEGVRWDASFQNLYVIDTGTASLYRVNPHTGHKTTLVTIPEPVYLDNFKPFKDSLIISESVHNSVIMFNLTTGQTRRVTPYTPFCLPGGASFHGNTLFIGDYIAQKKYDSVSGNLVTFGRGGPQPAPDPNISFGLYSVTASRSFTLWSCPFDGRVQLRDRHSNAVVTQVPVVNFPYQVAITRREDKFVVADYGVGLTVWSGTGFTNSVVLNTGSHTGFVGVVFDDTDEDFVFAGDYDNGQILRVDIRTGQFTVVTSGLSAPENIAISLGGNIIVAEVGRQRIVSVNPSNGVKSVVARNLPIGLAGPAPFPAANIPTGVAVNPQTGDIWFTSDLEDALYTIPLISY